MDGQESHFLIQWSDQLGVYEKAHTENIRTGTLLDQIINKILYNPNVYVQL